MSVKEPLLDINSDLNEIEEVHNAFTKEVSAIDNEITRIYSFENVEKLKLIMTRFQSLKLHFSKVNSRIKSLAASNSSQPSILSYLEKIMRSINTKYIDIERKFNTAIEKAKKKLDFETGINKNLEIYIDGGTGSGAKLLTMQENTKVTQIMNKLDLVTDKNKELEKLENISKTMAEISNEMKRTLYSQGEKLMTIEDNIIDTDLNIINANKEIDITSEAQTTCNSVCKWLTFLIGLCIFIVILIFYYFYWSGGDKTAADNEMIIRKNLKA